MKRKARKAQPKGRAASTPGRKPEQLTTLEELFAVEYVIDWNGSAAVRRAGYKVKTDVAAGVYANRLLKKDKVLARIERAKKEVLERAGVRAEAILLELAKIGFSSQRHLLTADAEGNIHLRPGQDIPDAAWDAVKSITAIDNESESESESPNGATRHSRSRQRTVSVVMHDKRAALVDLGRYAGIFGPEKVQVTTPEGQPIQVENVNAIPEADRAERVAALLAAAAARKANVPS
ncbi:terminase small subunit [Deinococcus sp. HMF7604]|uniref:terminase small subunit n=1 Tax=Deinococcus betulae TaxID=2873312 RepID=UPI001CCC921A|nr:terminase small subunit [Deinococcus betulae]MBZ9753194.1 terminase small subunit [Deinococcus betulae]